MTSSRDLLLHPIRLRIVQALAGRAATTLQLKEWLGDVPQATLYRHLNQLADGGLVHVVDERPVRGGLERTYAVVEAAVSLGPDAVAGATRDDHLRYFATFVGALISDFATYLDTDGADVGRDGVGYRQAPLWLTDDELDDLLARLGETLAPFLANEPSPERRRRLLTTILMPNGVSEPADA